MKPRTSIATRLTWMNLAVSATALLIAIAAFFTYDQITVRQAVVRGLSAQAQIVGFNSASALTFNDPQSAERTLSALRSSRGIVAAGILANDGKPFASYTRDQGSRVVSTISIPDGQTEASEFRENEVILARRIILDDKPIGTAYVISDLEVLQRRLNRYLWIALAVLLLSLGVATLTSRAFRRSIADPIVALAEVARSVSRDSNYAWRAMDENGPRELAILVDSFHTMLEEIHLREAALEAARLTLEHRVEERTQQLLAANRELEAFSYSVSHDLRGPLDTINGFAYLLKEDYAAGLDERGHEALATITGSTRRMAELIDDLLNLSRVSTTELIRGRVEVSEVARTVADELKRREPQRQVRFEIADCPAAEVDARLLRIAIENLMRNAWKYTSRHARALIQFGCEKRGEEVVYFVRDDGAGFDPYQAERLFKPFQRLHAASEFPGTGIGLATVQRIVNRHGGDIWATGDVEKGATFYFTLTGKLALPTSAAKLA